MNDAGKSVVEQARAWIERDAKDPYGGGYIGNLMLGLLARVEELEAQVDRMAGRVLDVMESAKQEER